MEDDRQYFANRAGSSYQNVVWRQAVLDEARVSGVGEAGAVLWDMSSFYERVPLGLLGERGAKWNVNTMFARVALNVYRGPRRIGYANIVSAEILAD